MLSNLTLFPIFLSLNNKTPEKGRPVPHWCNNQILVLAVAAFILMKCPENNYFWMQYLWKMFTPLIQCTCASAQSAQSTGASLFQEESPTVCPDTAVPYFGFFLGGGGMNLYSSSRSKYIGTEELESILWF